MFRVKLKGRYLLTLMVFVSALFVYFLCPICGLSQLRSRREASLIWRATAEIENQKEILSINGRELLSNVGANGLKEKSKERMTFTNRRASEIIQNKSIKATEESKNALQKKLYDLPNVTALEPPNEKSNGTKKREHFAQENQKASNMSENKLVIPQTASPEVDVVRELYAEEGPHNNEIDEDYEDYEEEAEVSNKQKRDNAKNNVFKDDRKTINSPKQNKSAEVAAPLPNEEAYIRDAGGLNLFIQDKMKESQKTKYIFDNQMHKVLLPHLTPEEVKRKMKDRLPWWELIEVENYPRIWFTGENAAKVTYNASNPFNFGFDVKKGKEGRFKFVSGDHLEYRYEILEELGHGSYGIVAKSRDHALPQDDPNRLVAVKVIHNDSSALRYFKEELDKMRLVHKLTKASEHFPRILRTLFFRNHFCIVMELLGNTLDEEYEDAVKDENILRKYLQDILRGLLLLHNKGIIHGDLKPENVMFASKCNDSCPNFLKIADFNLACIRNSEDFQCPGVYFQTRYYRAPEVALDLNYTITADMWSVGVILAELYLGKVPFYGESATDQLAAIMEVMGLVPPYMVETSPRIKLYQDAVCYVCKNGFKRMLYRKSLRNMLQGVTPDLFDFIQKCFELDFKKRWTSFEALRHPFIQNHHKS